MLHGFFWGLVLKEVYNTSLKKKKKKRKKKKKIHQGDIASNWKP